jgi:hypothetical protein
MRNGIRTHNVLAGVPTWLMGLPPVSSSHAYSYLMRNSFRTVLSGELTSNSRKEYTVKYLIRDLPTAGFFDSLRGLARRPICVLYNQVPVKRERNPGKRRASWAAEHFRLSVIVHMFDKLAGLTRGRINCQKFNFRIRSI